MDIFLCILFLYYFCTVVQALPCKCCMFPRCEHILCALKRAKSQKLLIMSRILQKVAGKAHLKHERHGLSIDKASSSAQQVNYKSDQLDVQSLETNPSQTEIINSKNNNNKGNSKNNNAVRLVQSRLIMLTNFQVLWPSLPIKRQNMPHNTTSERTLCNFHVGPAVDKKAKTSGQETC